MESHYSKVSLHPDTIKHLKKGSPWVTPDTISNKFPKKPPFLIGAGSRGEELFLLINDPENNHVKARLWSTKFPFIQQITHFDRELTPRLERSIEKRFQMKLEHDRDNYYLAFGEADHLPGLFILKLNNHVIIQSYCSFWKSQADTLRASLLNSMKEYFSDAAKFYYWFQERNDPEQVIFEPFTDRTAKLEIPLELTIHEFGINYQIHLGRHYDMGLFTDMASFRRRLISLFKKSETVLNLFSYTGAFSLLPLFHGAKEVISVDLSEKYLAWLDENLAINPKLPHHHHHPLPMAVEKALDLLSKKKKQFDMIICDPPSFASDGRRGISALTSYKKLLPAILNLLHPHSGYAFITLNTHHVSWDLFEKKIKEIIHHGTFNGRVEIKRLSMIEDCPVIAPFKEGNYIKGLLLKLKV